jgi:hypothetical protein
VIIVTWRVRSFVPPEPPPVTSVEAACGADASYRESGTSAVSGLWGTLKRSFWVGAAG